MEKELDPLYQMEREYQRKEAYLFDYQCTHRGVYQTPGTVLTTGHSNSLALTASNLTQTGEGGWEFSYE